MSNLCWSCDKKFSDMICENCGKLQPVKDMGPFKRLTIPVNFSIDQKKLEENYFNAQRKLHPDQHTSTSNQEKVYASQHSAALNDAYSVLRDPIKRSQALFKHYGHKAANIEEQTLQDPELLKEIMQLREEMLDIENEEHLSNLKHNIASKLDGAIHEISLAFNASQLDKAAKFLNQIRYYTKLKSELKNKRI